MPTKEKKTAAVKKSKSKPWGGRFNKTTDHVVEQFTESVSFDQRLYEKDIIASKAHASMLQKIGVLSRTEAQNIVRGLDQIAHTIQIGSFVWDSTLEDVHMNIEAALVHKIGALGKKLHTARSRNDQVATDLRLYLREKIENLHDEVVLLNTQLVELAEQYASTIMPGLTHLQAAQPITVGHHLLAWFEMLERDRTRLGDCHKRMNYSPLGSAALAGTIYPIDRYDTAKALGFSGVCENSLDAVSDRDYAIEFCATAAIMMMHLSRCAEEIILWMSQSCNFIEIDDAFCTGSSIMPQKKNPDIAELIRGKTGRVYGNLINLLTIMKGQPLAYNRDNQEDKESLFDSIDTVSRCVHVFRMMLGKVHFNTVQMMQAAQKGFLLATDLADQLVLHGVPFRDAHAITGKVVRHAIKKNYTLENMPLAAYQKIYSGITAKMVATLTLEKSVAARDHIGGTSPKQVKQAVKRARQRLKKSTLQK